MDSLVQDLEKLSRKGNLAKSIQDVQIIIHLLSNARDSISSNSASATVTLAKLQNPIRQSFDSVNNDLKEVYKGLGNYSKALDKKFKDRPLPTTDYDALSSQQSFIDRAIGMHFLREGQFAVASSFLAEALMGPTQKISTGSVDLFHDAPVDQEKTLELLNSEVLRRQFASMYYILDELRNKKNLLPAIAWAKANSSSLEVRGSNLEFELESLQFIWLFTGGRAADEGYEIGVRCGVALDYARREFGRFQEKYLRDIQRLVGAVAFGANLAHSPYRQIFHNQCAWGDIATSFTREFCSLLGLSAESPLYVASTAGAIALPTLLKLQNIMKEKRTEWTTQHELPVEIPLPSSYQFHSIFVCPVSKEQTTDSNPPMMMPCGHVVAHESLQRLSKSCKFKCPYCPGESNPKDAIKVFL